MGFYVSSQDNTDPIAVGVLEGGVRCANNRQRLLAQPSLILQPGV